MSAPLSLLRRRSVVAGLLGLSGIGCLQAQTTATQKVVLYIRENRNEAGQMLPLREEIRHLLDLIEQSSGIQFEIERYPYPRLMDKTRHQEGIAFGLSANRTVTDLILSEAFMSNKVWMVVRSDAVFPFRSIEDLRGKTIGVVRGSSYGDEFDARRNSLFKIEEDVSSHTARLRKLMSRRMDVMLFGDFHSRAEDVDLYLRHLLAEEKSLFGPGENFVVLEKPLMTDELCFAATPKFAEVLRRLNLAILQLRRSGELQRALQWQRKPA